MEENRFLKHFLLRKYCFSHFFSIFGQNNYNKITIMNNKRDLKRTINYVCSDLFAECVAESLYNSGEADKENIDTLLTTILVIHTDFIRRISHPEPGMKQKKFFKLLVKDFNKHVSEIIDQIGNIH